MEGLLSTGLPRLVFRALTIFGLITDFCIDFGRILCGNLFFFPLCLTLTVQCAGVTLSIHRVEY